MHGARAAAMGTAFVGLADDPSAFAYNPAGLAPAPGTRIGAYQVVGLLGSGGMGEVYRARDAVLQRDVAIKVLPPESGSDVVRLLRFEREARLRAAHNHPNIAAIYGVEAIPPAHSDGGATRALVLELDEGFRSAPAHL